MMTDFLSHVGMSVGRLVGDLVLVCVCMCEYGVNKLFSVVLGTEMNLRLR